MKIHSVCLSYGDLTKEDFTEIVKWLKSSVGFGHIEHVNAWADPTCCWSMWTNTFNHTAVFEFKDPQHALLFQLTFVG